MGSILAILLVFLVILLLFVSLGTGVGFLLRWLLGLDLGIAIVIGVVSTGFVLHFFVQLLGQLPDTPDEEVATEKDLPQVIIAPLRPQRRRGRRPR
jgi:hypothetical protein